MSHGGPTSTFHIYQKHNFFIGDKQRNTWCSLYMNVAMEDCTDGNGYFH